ncbi:chaperone protein ClpB3, mitochondrial-like [Pistacia vera]|uniref:chaperone protein ClpB3, mitochondrial-like n=1 Tax=Pistacia vera TaxID=55513 RepID=UPI001263AD65|nr:chaperone protein ClpB3, mitochondrial-like [Pistacia vera]
MASRRLTKSTLAALKSSRTLKLSLSQSGTRLSHSRLQSTSASASSFTSSLNSLCRPRIFNSIPQNDGASAKLSANAFTRKFHSSTPLRSSATSSSQANPTEYTEMAWEGIVGAVDAARVSNQQVVESEHLMKALLEQKDGLARRIFTKAGIDNTSVLQATDEFISQQPKVTGNTSGPVLGSHFCSLLDDSRKYKKEMGDDFVSVEHLLLAFHSDKRFGQQLFKNLQLSEKDLKEAIKAVRGNQRVTDQNPEGKYEVLDKYGNDLTELAAIK